MSVSNSVVGITIQEKDQSSSILPISTSVGAFVIKASQGIVNSRVLITRNSDLLNTFGKPNPNLGYGLYAGLNYLVESDSAYFVRATDGTELYSNANFGAVSATNITLSATSTTNTLTATGYEDGNTLNKILDIENYTFGGTQLFAVASIGPGSYGNNIAVQVFTSASPTSAGYDWLNKYDNNPLTDSNTIYNQVFKISVFVKSSTAPNFASVSATPVETFYVSLNQITDLNKNNLFLETVINGNSKYIYVKKGTSSGYPIPFNPTQLTGGADNTSITAGNIQNAWTLFNDKEKVLVNMLVCTECGDINSTNAAVQTAVGNIASSRQDCVSVSQIDGISATVTNPTTIVNNANYSYSNISYTGLYAGWQLTYDSYNDRQVYLPNAIFGASLMARTDRTDAVWVAAAGKNRGRVSTLSMFPNWNATQIGQLNAASINTTKSFVGNGVFMWAAKTGQRKLSALQEMPVRRMLVFAENSIANALQDFLWEANTASTRSRVRSVLNGFLGTMSAGGAFNNDTDAGFLVQCDSKNNTTPIIDSNQLVIDIFVRPLRTIQYIQLNVVIVNGTLTVNA